MERYEFREYELTEEAFNVYSNSDFVFYKDVDGTFFVSDNKYSVPYLVGDGTLQDVEEFLTYERSKYEE